MSTEKNIAGALVREKAREIDLGRKFSHPHAKTFVDEKRGATTFSFSIENKLGKDVVIAIASARNTQFDNIPVMLSAIGADALLTDGIVLQDPQVVTKAVTITSNDAGRLIAPVMSYIAETPTRMIDLSMASYSTDTGAPAPSNYGAKIKSVFVSPWIKPVENYLDLRKTQTNQSTAPQFAHVDFIKEGFPSVISNEAFMLVTVKKDTVLELAYSVGFQYSKAQEFYRRVKSADKTLAPLRRGNACDL